MSERLAIVGGLVIDPANNRHSVLNIFVEKGLIEDISSSLPPKDFKTIDAGGMVVTPGFIDLHTHLREPGQEYKEDIESGARSAAAGGFTAIFCMPNTNPVNDGIAVTRHIVKRSKEISPVHIHPVAALTKGLAGEDLVDLKALANEGILAVSDDGRSVQSDEVMKKAMKIAKDLDLLVITHPEDYRRAKNSRDAENFMIERDIKLAGETGVRFHVAHLSTREGIKMVAEAKKKGLKVTCEVTPHHLFLTEEDVGGRPNWKMNPPLRGVLDREALRNGLLDGTVDAIATDHAPHAPHEKVDFATAPFGVIGMETALPVCLKLVTEGRITLERLIELLTAGPARVVPLKAGSLLEGASADITIFDPKASYTIDVEKFRSKSRNSPFHGWKVKGKVLYTIVNGKIVYP